MPSPAPGARPGPDRRTGLFEQRGQSEAGVLGVAASLCDMTRHKIAAISLTSSTPAAPERVRAAVQPAADRIAAQRGGRPDAPFHAMGGAGFRGVPEA